MGDNNLDKSKRTAGFSQETVPNHNDVVYQQVCLAGKEGEHRSRVGCLQRKVEDQRIIENFEERSIFKIICTHFPMLPSTQRKA